MQYGIFIKHAVLNFNIFFLLANMYNLTQVCDIFLAVLIYISTRFFLLRGKFSYQVFLDLFSIHQPFF